MAVASWLLPVPGSPAMQVCFPRAMRPGHSHSTHSGSISDAQRQIRSPGLDLRLGLCSFRSPPGSSRARRGVTEIDVRLHGERTADAFGRAKQIEWKAWTSSARRSCSSASRPTSSKRTCARRPCRPVIAPISHIVERVGPGLEPRLRQGRSAKPISFPRPVRSHRGGGSRRVCNCHASRDLYLSVTFGNLYLEPSVDLMFGERDAICAQLDRLWELTRVDQAIRWAWVYRTALGPGEVHRIREASSLPPW